MNKKAIFDRGWYPYNRNLLIDPSIRASITKEEEKNEVLATSTIILTTKAKEHSIFICNNQQPTFNPTYLENSVNEEIKEVKFATGMSAWCIDTILQKYDLNEARIGIKKNRKVCQTLKEKLVESKSIIAGRLFKAGSVRIGKTLFGIQKENRDNENAATIEKEVQARETYLNQRAAAYAIIDLGIEPTMLSSEQLKTILLPLKLRSDDPMPTLKAKQFTAYMKWKYRQPPPAPVREASAQAIDEDAVVVAELINEAEAIMAMLDLAAATDIVHQ